MAGNKIHEIELDGATWTLSTLRATEGLEVLTKIIGITGGSFMSLGGGDENAQGGALLGGLASRIAEPGTVPLIKKLLASLHKNASPVKFDDEFAENYGPLIDLVEWALTINYESTLKKSRVVGTLIELFKKQKGSTQARLTGGSGELSPQGNALS